ncbi:conserved hypothetical protein [Vibrio chagasii]|nr:conserved hypothetical protein [Vibrio chagasii]CAH7375045.1 conserved hypothetical protein [Vibrio chagasii]
MTIFVNSELLQHSLKRVRDYCDSVGIRLGKGKKIPEGIVCAALNLPNWHVATVAAGGYVTTDFGLETQALDFRLLAGSSIKVSKTNPKHSLHGVLTSILGAQNPNDLRNIIAFSSHYLSGVSASMRMFGFKNSVDENDFYYLNDNNAAYMMLHLLSQNYVSLVPKCARELVNEAYNSLVSEYGKHNGLLPCSHCGEESDFTMPFSAETNFVVCQSCGTRKTSELWNNPCAPSLEMVTHVTDEIFSESELSQILTPIQLRHNLSEMDSRLGTLLANLIQAPISMLDKSDEIGSSYSLITKGSIITRGHDVFLVLSESIESVQLKHVTTGEVLNNERAWTRSSKLLGIAHI